MTIIISVNQHRAVSNGEEKQRIMQNTHAPANRCRGNVAPVGEQRARIRPRRGPTTPDSRDYSEDLEDTQKKEANCYQANDSRLLPSFFLF